VNWALAAVHKKTTEREKMRILRIIFRVIFVAVGKIDRWTEEDDVQEEKKGRKNNKTYLFSK